jgi:hypothetical protein
VNESRTVAVDFDGVLHRYHLGWQGEIPTEEPVLGAAEGVAAIRAAGFRVVVFSCRALVKAGRDGIVAWLAQHKIEVDEVTAIKPHAVVYLDDRAVRFTGSWADAARVASTAPAPWNKVAPPMPMCWVCGKAVDAVRSDGHYVACGHPIPERHAVDVEPETWLVSDNERWTNGAEFPSRDAAIADGPKTIEEDRGEALEDGDFFYIGKKVPPNVAEHVDWASLVIERLPEAAHDALGCGDTEDLIGDWPNPTKAQEADLDARIKAVVNAWMDDHALRPDFFVLDKIEDIQVLDGVPVKVERRKRAAGGGA